MTPVAERVQRHRNSLRKAGLRPIQIWVPDTRAPGFDEECLRQSRLAAKADAQDLEINALLEEAAEDIEGWV